MEMSTLLPKDNPSPNPTDKDHDFIFNLMKLIFFEEQESVKAGAESRTDGWVQFDGEELHQLQQQQRRNSMPVEKNAMWQMMHLSSLPDLTHLINNPTGCTTTTTTRTAVRTMDMDPKQLINNHHNNPNYKTSPSSPPHDHSIFIAPYRSTTTARNQRHHQLCNQEEDMSSGDQSQTLQLFPLRSSCCGEKDHLTTEKSALNPNYGTGPNYQFFEFLPLKN